MQKVNQLLNDPCFLEYMEKNRKAETDRIFCRHDLTHALDVARIAYILNMEENLLLDKEIIYAAALLHDIGRWLEYENGADHAEASATLAEDLLDKYGFAPRDKAEIITAIGSHRKSVHTALLSDVLYKADKLSRNCVSCGAINKCKKFANNQKPKLKY